MVVDGYDPSRLLAVTWQLPADTGVTRTFRGYVDKLNTGAYADLIEIAREVVTL